MSEYSDEELLMGIDEAGRGSIIGPMIVAGVVVDSKDISLLSKIGVRDSKKLSRNARRKLYEIIIKNSRWVGSVYISPIEIDQENLNKLTFKAICKLVIDAIEKNGFVKKVFIDNVTGLKEDELKNEISRKNPIANKIEFRIEVKADQKYIPVAAASIIAKVLRDNVIEEYRRKYGVEGSGYPGDYRTRAWLSQIRGNIPRQIIRLKWKTIEKLGVKNNDLLRYIRGRDYAGESASRSEG